MLDEVCAAVNTGLLPLEEVLYCLEAAVCEVVLTGRDPAPELLDRADYVTEMRKLRHPYDRGTAARHGGGVVSPLLLEDVRHAEKSSVFSQCSAE